jgi:endonuclease/exonuclease/phosphatase family metal-dependent hydrolase
MADMVERVRDAIVEALIAGDFNAAVSDYDTANNPAMMRIDGHFDMMAVARAAIEAMREPTPEMRDRLWELYLNRVTLDEDWQAMIDAALTPSPPSQ